MAEVEEPQFNTLAERIAALNRQKNFQAPPSGAAAAGKRAPPPPPPNRAATQTIIASQEVSAQKSPVIPPRPTRAATERAPALPRRTTTTNDGGAGHEASPPLPARNLAPPLPTRNSSQQQQQDSPALPPRRPSAQSALSVRRNSNASDISYLSTVSNLSLSHTVSSAGTSVGSETQQPLRRLPPALDQAKLPPLPPTRRELEARAKEAAEKEASSQLVSRAPLLPSKSAPAVARAAIDAAPRPSLPPRLPTRPGRSPIIPASDEGPPPALPTRRLPPPPTTYAPKSPHQGGLKKPNGDDVPPPIPLASRPTLAQIDAARSSSSSSSRPTAVSRSASAPVGSLCLVCRDFSGPDTVASQHPTSSLPRHDTVGYLAHVLCDPFPSLTDKARAIFTWFHHNIQYDVYGLFNNCIPRGQTPEETIFSGKAVCEGYAKVYLAIAQRAGLECVLIGGHGKGLGFTPLTPADPTPPEDATGHAWNAVRIDADEWKVLDACWGAGHVCTGKYVQRFAPEMFYLPNDMIGLKHFPADKRHFFRHDGRVPSWEEYIRGPTGGKEAARWYNAGTDEGLSEFTFAPREKYIPVYNYPENNGVVRFQFSKLCEHWTPEKNGKGKQMLFALKIHGLDGRKEDLVVLDYDGGYWWWLDIQARDLGCPGQKITLFGFTTIDGRDARGVTKEEWLRKKGRCGYAMTSIAEWELI
ncbi:hypothetical protein QBC46DRAFT_373469 [Diplogelasinospora grovesii]|uniref:Transglutaminase-like domain-containing protein n=1 Tax=Diplogelasinospora grovesii TaxID=303347 RepID=A0AAN6NFK2_9PEZI|nr:hypothetical protein QBC46DRAFT_373469 [Diplogelasinospora grovesii]